MTFSRSASVATVRARRPRFARVLSASLLAVLGAAVSCTDFGMGDWGSDCTTDAECPRGQGCNHHFLGTTCEVRCALNEDCAADQFCDTTSWSSFATCAPGCHSDPQCGSGRICEDGSCQAGCREDSECSAGARCVCHQCAEGACRSRADCAEDEYCPLRFSLGCRVTICTPLPPPIQCGQTTCNGTTAAFSFWSVTAVPPCCVEAACGLDASALIPAATGCQLLAQPGSSDPSCPPDAISSSPLMPVVSELPGCRRVDGRCGYLVDDSTGVIGLGLGCIAAP